MRSAPSFENHLTSIFLDDMLGLMRDMNSLSSPRIPAVCWEAFLHI
jgi:hypothetical protein